MLDQLWGTLTQSEKDERKDCYAAARDYIQRTPSNGIAAPFSVSFRNRKLRRGVRIDLEIRGGDACVHDP